jgi:hypothetical protein
MGTRRNKTIAVQNPHGLAAPQLQDQLWVRIHRMDAHRKQNGRCAYCREPMTRLQATADHVVPRIKGGATSEENIKAACQPCNKAKSSMTEARFKKIIRFPPAEHSIDVLLANFRLRLWSRVELAERRILAYVGL